MNLSYMQEFAAKHNLPRQGRVCLVEDTERPFLTIEHPVVLARFISFVKARCAEHNAEVYLRGQTEDFAGMFPGLYRETASSSEKDNRWRAYLAALERLGGVITLNRFRRNNLGALLQHYGLRTPWLDVVDNIYVALWFSQHGVNKSNDATSFIRRQEGNGWIYLISTRGHKPFLHCVDLRKRHSSLSVRPHVQHGVSLARQSDADEKRYGSDFERYLVGRVRFSLGSQWLMDGALATAEFMFPSPELDHSALVLQDPAANQVLDTVEREFGVAPLTLGRFSPTLCSNPAAA